MKPSSGLNQKKNSYLYAVKSTIDPDNPYGFRTYVETMPKNVNARKSMGMDEYVLTIVSQEYPVHLEVVVDRVYQNFWHGDTRQLIGNKVQLIVNDLDEIVWDGEYLLPKNHYPIHPQAVENTRNIKHISVRELSIAMVMILRVAMSMTREELIKETRERYGYKRTGEQIQQALSNVIRRLLESHEIKEVNGKLILSE